MFGPVTRRIRPALSPERSQALAMNASPALVRAASTTGWRPPSIRKARPSSTTGRVQFSSTASSACEAATSSAASAPAAATIESDSAITARDRLSKISSSRASPRPAALAIFVSSSPSSTLVKRIASTMVWRWTKVARQGSLSRVSPKACGTSMK